MSRELVFLPELTGDLIEGFNYYEGLSPGRGGERFETAVKLALLQVEAGVVTHFQAFEHFHRVGVPDYPYNLYYRLVGDRAVISALLYARFDPGRIQQTLGKRV